uniref:Uncharacterized protein n=1 Tax=Strongyloides stercoralis TaxID=6248 RepID=A0A0K0E4Y7_STRER
MHQFGILKEESKKRKEIHFENAIEKVYHHKRCIRSLIQDCINNKKSNEDDLNNKKIKVLQNFANTLYNLSFKGSQRVNKHGIAQAFVFEFEKKLKIKSNIISFKRIQSSKQSFDYREKEMNKYENDLKKISISIKNYENLVGYFQIKSVPQFFEKLEEIIKLDDIENIVKSFGEEQLLPGEPKKDSFTIIVQNLKVYKGCPKIKCHV